ncbi:NIN-like protein [Tanacetum coccineum]
MEFWGESRYLTQLSQSDSSESVINSARDNVNSTINPDLGLEITNDTITGGREKSNYMKRCRKHKIDSLTMEAVEKFFGKPIDEAAASLAGNTSTLKRFCREHGLLSWPLPKHNKRTVDVTDSKLSRISKSSQNLQLSLDSPFGLFGAVLLLVRIKRWSCSSKHHGLSGKWWSCGKHNYPAYKSDSLYQVVRLMVSLKRWRKRNAIKYAMQNNDRLVVSDYNKGSKKRKRIDLPSSLEEIREHCGKTMKKVMNNLGVGTGKLRCILQWWSYTEIPKLIQAPVVTSTSEEAPASVVAAQFKETMREQFIENATTSTLKEMVATRFQLKPGSFKLKYVDKDGDEILIACDTDLMGSVGDSKQPVNSSVIRLLVFSAAPY